MLCFLFWNAYLFISSGISFSFKNIIVCFKFKKYPIKRYTFWLLNVTYALRSSNIKWTVGNFLWENLLHHIKDFVTKNEKKMRNIYFVQKIVFNYHEQKIEILLSFILLPYSFYFLFEYISNKLKIKNKEILLYLRFFRIIHL